MNVKLILLERVAQQSQGGPSSRRPKTWWRDAEPDCSEKDLVFNASSKWWRAAQTLFLSLFPSFSGISSGLHGPDRTHLMGTVASCWRGFGEVKHRSSHSTSVSENFGQLGVSTRPFVSTVTADRTPCHEVPSWALPVVILHFQPVCTGRQRHRMPPNHLSTKNCRPPTDRQSQSSAMFSV